MSYLVCYTMCMIVKKNWRIRTRNLTSGHVHAQVIFNSTHEEALKIALADHPNSVMQSGEPGGDEIWIDQVFSGLRPHFHAKRPAFRKEWEKHTVELPPLPV